VDALSMHGSSVVRQLLNVASKRAVVLNNKKHYVSFHSLFSSLETVFSDKYDKDTALV
jgi:hypothetical protein